MVIASQTTRLLASLLLTLTTITLAVGGLPWRSRSDGWNDTRLADDREAMLAELIPGSDDYYFYHCLYHQTTGQLERSEAILRDWLAEHRGRETPTITAMIDRQRLLTYSDSPQRTIDHWSGDLASSSIMHRRRPRTSVDFPQPARSGGLEVETAGQGALSRNDATQAARHPVLGGKVPSRRTPPGSRLSLHDFLGRVIDGYVDGLDELVIKELASRRPNEKRFGDLRAHSYLTLEELRKVAARVPEVADDGPFVSAMLRRLRPDADSDPGQQQQVRMDYLTRVEAYLRTLPPSYNSMKASATYRLLEANLERGSFRSRPVPAVLAAAPRPVRSFIRIGCVDGVGRRI